jgi:hypothetical protein
MVCADVARLTKIVIVVEILLLVHSDASDVTYAKRWVRDIVMTCNIIFIVVYVIYGIHVIHIVGFIVTEQIIRWIIVG